MSAKNDAYWRECVETALDECGLAATAEQIEYIAGAASGAHEHYGMAFYSPPSFDGYARQEREWKAKFEALQREFDQYRSGAERAVRTALRQRHDESIGIQPDGSVLRYGGRTEQIL